MPPSKWACAVLIPTIVRFLSPLRGGPAAWARSYHTPWPRRLGRRALARWAAHRAASLSRHGVLRLPARAVILLRGNGQLSDHEQVTPDVADAAAAEGATLPLPALGVVAAGDTLGGRAPRMSPRRRWLFSGAAMLVALSLLGGGLAGV